MKYRQTVNTGNGAKDALKTENHGTEERFQPFQKKGKKNMSKIKSPITKEEAVELLQSAISYCADAGIAVQGYTNNGTLFLALEGILLVQDGDTMKFVPVNVPVNPPHPTG